MKKISYSFLLFFILFLLTGCNSSPKITEEEAMAVVMERHSKNAGEVEIVSVSHQNGEYLVKWEIDADCQFGTDYVDDQSGKVMGGNETNC
jgi:uncharacterized protein YcfL